MTPSVSLRKDRVPAWRNPTRNLNLLGSFLYSLSGQLRLTESIASQRRIPSGGHGTHIDLNEEFGSEVDGLRRYAGCFYTKVLASVCTMQYLVPVEDILYIPHNYGELLGWGAGARMEALKWKDWKRCSQKKRGVYCSGGSDRGRCIQYRKYNQQTRCNTVLKQSAGTKLWRFCMKFLNFT